MLSSPTVFAVGLPVPVVKDGCLVRQSTDQKSDCTSDAEHLDLTDLHAALVDAFAKSSSIWQHSNTQRLRRPTVQDEAFKDRPWHTTLSLELLIRPEPFPDPGIRVTGYSMDQKIDGAGCQSTFITRFPPVRMSVHFVPGYPLAKIPGLVLESEWMLPHDLERVGKALMAIAEDLGLGAPIILAWVEWLRCESMAGVTDMSISPSSGQQAIRLSPNNLIEQVSRTLTLYSC